MTPIDRAELSAAMADLAVDDAAAIPFVRAYGDRLAGVVRRILIDFGRRDLARDDAEVNGLVWEAAFVIAERAGAWDPTGALPWSWAYRAIRSVVAGQIGNARTDADVEALDLVDPASTRPGSGAADVDLARLAADEPAFALLLEALALVGCTERQRDVHLEYRIQKALGDPSPANTVGAAFGLSPANVRQIDRRVRQRIIDLAAEDERFFALRDLPWLTGRTGPPTTDDADQAPPAVTAEADLLRDAVATSDTASSAA